MFVDPFRREGIALSMYYVWPREFLVAGKRRLAGDISRAANTDEVKGLRRDVAELKEVVAEQTLELRFFKKSMIAYRTDGVWGIPHPRKLRLSKWLNSRPCRRKRRWNSSGRHAPPSVASITDTAPVVPKPDRRVGSGTDRAITS